MNAMERIGPGLTGEEGAAPGADEGQELFAGFRIVAEVAKHRRCHRLAVDLLDAAHHHAHVPVGDQTNTQTNKNNPDWISWIEFAIVYPYKSPTEFQMILPGFPYGTYHHHHHRPHYYNQRIRTKSQRIPNHLRINPWRIARNPLGGFKCVSEIGPEHRNQLSARIP